MSVDLIVVLCMMVIGLIGVVFQKFNFDGFYEWFGVNIECIIMDQNVMIFNFLFWDEEDWEKVIEWMDSLYCGFMEVVVEGCELLIEKV